MCLGFGDLQDWPFEVSAAKGARDLSQLFYRSWDKVCQRSN